MVTPCNPRALPRAQGGFLLSATILLLLVTALLTFTLARRWEVEDRLAKERDLMWIGEQFRFALASYSAVTTEDGGRAPRTLEDLLDDRRGQLRRQHLRRIYVDPMTGKAQWGLVKDASGGIVGVHSQSQAKPLPRDRLWPFEPAWAKAPRYADWVFSPGVTGRF